MLTLHTFTLCLNGILLQSYSRLHHWWELPTICDHWSTNWLLEGGHTFYISCLVPSYTYCTSCNKEMVISINGYVEILMNNTHTRPFNGPFSGTTQVSQYQKGKTNLDFTEARDSEWQWHQLGHMSVCTSLQTDNHTSTPPLSILQAGCSSCRPTNSVKALKANEHEQLMNNFAVISVF